MRSSRDIDRARRDRGSTMYGPAIRARDPVSGLVDARSGQAAELPPGGDPELAEDVAQVRVDGARAEEEPGRDLLRGGAGGDLSGDVSLLHGELVGRLAGPAAGPFAGGAQLVGGPPGERLDAVRG